MGTEPHLEMETVIKGQVALSKRTLFPHRDWVIVYNSIGLLGILIIVALMVWVLRQELPAEPSNLVLTPQIPLISPAQAYDNLSQNPEAVLLDVRLAHRGPFIEGATWMPLLELQRRAEMEFPDKSVEFYLISDTNNQDSLFAAEWLMAHGYSEVVYIENGITAWVDAGLPMSRE